MTKNPTRRERTAERVKSQGLLPEGLKAEYDLIEKLRARAPFADEFASAPRARVEPESPFARRGHGQ